MNSASALSMTGQVRVELCLMSSDYSDSDTIACAGISVNMYCKYFVPALRIIICPPALIAAFSDRQCLQYSPSYHAWNIRMYQI